MDKLLYLLVLLVTDFASCQKVKYQFTQSNLHPKSNSWFLENMVNFVERLSRQEHSPLSSQCQSSLKQLLNELKDPIDTCSKSVPATGRVDDSSTQSSSQLNNAKCQADCEPNKVCFVFSSKGNLDSSCSMATCLECESLNAIYFNQMPLTDIHTRVTLSPNSSDPPKVEREQSHFSPLNWIILIYTSNSLVCTLIVALAPGYSGSKVLKSFDILSNLAKLTSHDQSKLTKIQFINSVRVISLAVLLTFHPLNPVYSSLRLYFYADYFSFVRKESLASVNVITIVTAVNLALTSAMFTVIWLPNLRKEDGFMSFCSFLALRFVKTKSAMLTMVLLIRSLPNYATGGRSIFIFIQRVTAARVVTWYHKTNGQFDLTLDSRRHTFYAYTGIFLCVKYLYSSHMIRHSFANLFVITLMAAHGIVKNTFDLNKWHIFSLDHQILQLTYLYIAINMVGMSFGFLLCNFPLTSPSSKVFMVKNVSILLLISSFALFSWVKKYLTPPVKFISSSTVILTTCASICGLLLVGYYDRTSFINRVSSHKLAVPITRIFYSMLLAHPFVEELFTHSQLLAQLEPNFFSNRFLFIISLLPAGLLMNLLIEAPFYNLSNLLMYSGYKNDVKRATKSSEMGQITQEVC